MTLKWGICIAMTAKWFKQVAQHIAYVGVA